MSRISPTNEINTLMIQKNLYEMKLAELNKEVKYYNNNIEIIKQELRDKCNHNKKINHMVQDEKTQYYCTICNSDL